MRKETCFIFIYAFAIIFTCACNSQAKAASADANFTPVNPETVVAEILKDSSENIDPVDLAKEQLRGEYYKEALDT